MKKLILFLSLAVTGLMTSCMDKNEEVDADSKPGWLHGSIYEELKNPAGDGSGLEGTFTNYLRLIDDLGYAETLSRTGSKTVFPANDEAFARFFQSNEWGVTSYEQLTEAQKKLLLYSSMLDNALLTGMLSNVSNGSSSTQNGLALKHRTNISVIDSIQFLMMSEMPRNNKHWAKHYNSAGIHVVNDNTVPMMVHFTREQMVNNNITVTGENSDFQILTGSPYNMGDVYIYDDKVIHPDITCINGYIHQVQNVLLQPGNMDQVIAKDNETSYFSRILNYFSAPYYDLQTTNNYNDWAIQNNKPMIDSIFQKRFLSSYSQGATLIDDPDGNTVSSYLSYDPGWNQYYPKANYSSSLDRTISDIGAMFVPDNKAFEDYFLQGGNGAYLIDIYGKYRGGQNTAANLAENLDSIQMKNPDILKQFVRNLQLKSFVQTVPSKFTTIMNDASENMGMNMSYLKQKADGRYDVKIANNGVVYVLNKMLAPDEYQAVLAPASVYPDMKVMNWAVQDRDYLGVDFKFYLLAMSANYAFFIPDDEAFEYYYVNPVTLGGAQAEAIRFYYDEKKMPHLRADYYAYNKNTNTIGERLGEYDLTTQLNNVKSQLIDILNYHTVVLKDGEMIGNNKYYKTKHGGEICVEGGNVTGATVSSGAQIDNGQKKPEIEKIYPEKNGNAYRINRIIQAPRNSVFKTLSDNSRFSEFLAACSGFGDTEILTWAGISSEVDSKTGKSEQDRYMIFTTSYGSGSSKINNACIDENVRMFNTYNYTLYAPDNDAMEEAYRMGLPRWSEIQALKEKYTGSDDDEVTAEEQADKEKAYVMINTLREFVRYHFQNVSLYADHTVDGGKYATMHSDDLGVAENITVSGGGNRLVVTDGAGIQHVVNADDNSKISNKMTRDYWFNAPHMSATSIVTSSFCAVHQISRPFYMGGTSNTPERYDTGWSSAKSRKQAVSYYKRLNANNKL